MKTVLVDLDGVVLNLAAEVHRFAQRRLSRSLPPPESWRPYNFSEAMGLSRSNWEFLQDSMRRSNKLGYLRQFYPQAQAFIEHLAGSHRVVFVTTPWRGLPHWVESTYSLLDHYLNRRNFSIVFTADKHLVAGDWLVDDKWENLEKTPDRGILFSRPWNEKFENQAHYVADGFADVLGIVEGATSVAATIEPSSVNARKKSARKKTAKKR